MAYMKQKDIPRVMKHFPPYRPKPLLASSQSWSCNIVLQ